MKKEKTENHLIMATTGVCLGALVIAAAAFQRVEWQKHQQKKLTKSLKKNLRLKERKRLKHWKC